MAEPTLLTLLPHLMRLSRVIGRGQLVERAMAATNSGLDRPAMSVLFQLRMAEEPLRIGEIAARMEVAGPHVTRLVQGIERRKLVRRVVDPQDQRARLIDLTPEGRQVTDRYLETILGWFEEALAAWPAEDRDRFATLTKRFADDLANRLARLDEED
ncbi:MarR family winged helix-turn-helix transcriptional regulator [Amycolatopsis sacchari]|uniref:MarR family winged helix-turn-helix transcriptional regulator n=1 Tax=Amycolatopsis sacchari TaxID=115433 RepID=UPI003EC07839